MTKEEIQQAIEKQTEEVVSRSNAELQEKVEQSFAAKYYLLRKESVKKVIAFFGLGTLTGVIAVLGGAYAMIHSADGQIATRACQNSQKQAEEIVHAMQESKQEADSIIATMKTTNWDGVKLVADHVEPNADQGLSIKYGSNPLFRLDLNGNGAIAINILQPDGTPKLHSYNILDPLNPLTR